MREVFNAFGRKTKLAQSGLIDMNIKDPEVQYRAVLMYVLGEAMDSLQDCESREAMQIMSLLRSKINKGEVMEYYGDMVLNLDAINNEKV